MEGIVKLMAGESVFVPSGGIRIHMQGHEPPAPQGITITNAGANPVTVGTMYL